MSARGWLSLLVVTVASCAGSQRQTTVAMPLATAITLTEITEDGEAIPIPAHGLAEVDVNSTIELKMDQAAIAAEAAKLAGEEGAQTPSEPQLAVALNAMDELTKVELARARLFGKLIEALAASRPVPQKHMAELGRIESKVMSILGQYALVAQVDRQTVNEVFRKPGYQGLADWINEERSRLLARVQARRDKRQTLRWRLEATSSRGPIHLPNYDDLPAGAAHRLNKINLLPDARTLQDFDAAKALSADLNRLISEKGSLDQALRAKFEQVVGERLRRAQQAWEGWASLDWSTVQDLANRPKAKLGSDPDVKVVVAQVPAIIEGAQALQRACGKVPAVLKSILDTHAFTGIDLGGVSSCFLAVRDRVPTLQPALEAIAKAGASLLEKAEASAGPEAATLKAEVASWRLQTLSQAKAAADQLSKAWSDVATILGLQHEMATLVWRTDHFQDRPTTDVRNTAIELPTIDRQPGDQVAVRPALTKDGSPVLVGPQHTLQVVQQGVRVDVGAAVTFIRPANLGAGEDRFGAAPAVTVALHYRSGRAAGQIRGNRVWNFLDPGIGGHFAYPNLGHTTVDADGHVISRDSNFEIGLGGVVQLFGDLIQAGAGYDLQVGRRYWYVGLGLQRLTDLGISLPRSRGPAAASP